MRLIQTAPTGRDAVDADRTLKQDVRSAPGDDDVLDVEEQHGFGGLPGLVRLLLSSHYLTRKALCC